MVFIVKSKLRNKQEIKMAKTKEISFKVCSNLSGELLYLGGILCLFVFSERGVNKNVRTQTGQLDLQLNPYASHWSFIISFFFKKKIK